MATTINASTSAGLVSTADTSGVLQLQTAGTTALTISTAQLATLAGGLNFSTLDAGITFNKTGALVNSTLNDYEVGTWTPTIGAYAGTVTAYTSSGSYVKIGKQVFCTVYANISNAGTASNSYTISNLPFSIAVPSQLYVYGVNVATNTSLVGYGASSTTLYVISYNGTFPGGSGTYVAVNFNYGV
jgi:hypothetical protein